MVPGARADNWISHDSIDDSFMRFLVTFPIFFEIMGLRFVREVRRRFDNDKVVDVRRMSMETNFEPVEFRREQNQIKNFARSIEGRESMLIAGFSSAIERGEYVCEGRTYSAKYTFWIEIVIA